MKWKPKDKKTQRIPSGVELYFNFEGYDDPRVNGFQWRGATLQCSKCGYVFSYELYMGKIFTPTAGYPADNPKLSEEINRKISAHYWEFHKGFN